MMINLCFAFDHINYARYLTHQHVHFGKMQHDKHPAIADLRNRGFGGSWPESNFSTLHEDLVTEVEETKRQVGPSRLGYSTNSDAVKERVTTAHVRAKLKEKLDEKIKLSTSRGKSL